MTGKNQFRVSVVLPTYNEAGNIKEAIERISKALGKYLLEIIVVDDNSPDGTWKIVQDISKKNNKVKLINRINKRGLASALADGVEKTKGNVVVWMDPDLGLPPETVPELVEKLSYYDVAIGSRYAKGGKDARSKFRAFLSYLFNLYASIILSFKVRDYTSGFVAVKKEVFDKVKINPEGFGEYFVDFAYRCIKNGFRIAEVGYVYVDRKTGESKYNIWGLLKYGIQYGFKVIKLKFTAR